jgi:hypothetical protein
MLAAALPMQAMAKGGQPILSNTNPVKIGGADELLVFDTKVELKVYINGDFSGKLSDTYTFDTDINLAAPETASGKNFSYWEAEGNILSYDRNIKLSLTANTTLNAVYGKNVTAAAQAVGFTSVNKDNDGNILLNAFTTDTNATEVGTYYSTTASTKSTLISSGTKETGTKDRNSCWTLTLEPEKGKDYYYAMPYVMDGSATYYGTVKEVRLSNLDYSSSSTLNSDMAEDGDFGEIDLSEISAAEVKKVPTGKSLTYTSKEQTLITAGTAEGGTMQYSFDEYSGYSTELPTAKEIGSYTIWYKAAGDGSHLSSKANSVTARISQAPTYYSQKWTLTMDSYEYDGTAHEPIIKGTMYGEVTYSYTNTDTGEELDSAPSAVGNYKVEVFAEGGPSYYSRIQYATYSITDLIDENGMANVDAFKENGTVPVSNGKIFAGWFTDETCTTPYTEDTGKAYAKFIDEKILTVKAQISSGTTANSESTSIRFITSVDSLKYQNVGFKITFNGKTIDKQMTKVYTAINASGVRVKPTVFSEDSKYMEAYTLNNIPQSAFDKEFTVTPYYTTQDGTIVEGETKSFTIANMIK